MPSYFHNFILDTINYLLTGEMVDVSSPTIATFNCTFLSGFTGSARCTVQYGTDPTYMNLPYSAESTETGTAGDTISVVLREQLNSSTVYYCNVSAVSGDVAVTVQGNFSTPQYSKYVCAMCFSMLDIAQQNVHNCIVLLSLHRLSPDGALEPVSSWC